MWQKLSHPRILEFVGIDEDALRDEGELRIISPWMTHGTLMDFLGNAGDSPTDNDLIVSEVYHHLSPKMLITQSSQIYCLDSTTFIRSRSLMETCTEWVEEPYVFACSDPAFQSNVFINSEGHALLGDFGLTAISDLKSVTTTINNAGALRWLSPEVRTILLTMLIAHG
jgi:hypothetical protein